MKRMMSQLRGNILMAAVAVACIAAVPASVDASLAKKAWAEGPISSVEMKKNTMGTPQKKGATNAMPTKSPTKAIKDLDAKLDSFKTGNNLTPQQEEYNRQLKMDVIHGTFDVRELSKLSLAKHWSGLSAGERDRFVNLMVSLLEEKALFSKEQSAAKSKSGGKYRVIYKGHKYISKGKRKAFVRTKVLVPSENVDIDLNYKLRVKDGEWKIYDVIVDEASLVANYKYQFNSIIKKHGYNELVSRMSRKLDEIKDNRKQKKKKKKTSA